MDIARIFKVTCTVPVQEPYRSSLVCPLILHSYDRFLLVQKTQIPVKILNCTALPFGPKDTFQAWELYSSDRIFTVTCTAVQVTLKIKYAISHQKPCQTSHDCKGVFWVQTAELYRSLGSMSP